MLKLIILFMNYATKKVFFCDLVTLFCQKGCLKREMKKKCRARRHRFVAVARLKDFPVI